MAVAAKGTLVAGGVAADIVVGVAPCIMGTFKREPWKRHTGGWRVNGNHSNTWWIGGAWYCSSKPCDITMKVTPGAACNHSAKQR